MKTLITEQIERAEAIERTHVYMKKEDGRINAEDCQRKMKQLKQQWNNFNEWHEYLEEILPATDGYFTEDIYGKTETKYNQALSHITKIKKKLQDYAILRRQIANIEIFMRELTEFEDYLKNPKCMELVKVKLEFMEKRWYDVTVLEVEISSMDKKDSKSYMESGKFDEAYSKKRGIIPKILKAIQMGKTIEPPRTNLSAVTIPIPTKQHESLSKMNDGLVTKSTHFGTAPSSPQLFKTDPIKNVNENAPLTKFRNIEEAEDLIETTQDDAIVEESYASTVERNEHGYTVKIPKKKYATQLDESQTRSMAGQVQLENKLDKNEKLSVMYECKEAGQLRDYFN